MTNTPKIKYDFSGKLWRHSTAGWYFISLPLDISNEIRENLQWQEEGWGRMKVSAIIMELEWETAIWFTKKENIYVLPIKAAIRKKLKLEEEIEIEVRVLV